MSTLETFMAGWLVGCASMFVIYRWALWMQARDAADDRTERFREHCQRQNERFRANRWSE